MHDVAPTLEATFRESSVPLVAALTRVLGPSRLDLVESVVQEAFVRAVNAWRDGVPANPAGWVHAVAKNLALDHVRRERSLRSKEAAIAYEIERTAEADAARPRLAGELVDDQLAMIFVACHPCNSVPSQVALALRTLCGLEIGAIARAMYATEEAIERRLVHARRRIREEDVSFEVPPASELGARLDAVLRVLYLLFNEAYWGTSGPDLVQPDVAFEAIRLTTFLADHPATRRPDVFALLALMHFHASRFAARVDATGTPVPLADQDRSRWDNRGIALGLRCLASSAEGTAASPYHYEAAIAAVHATASSHTATDWARIVRFYDELLGVYVSPGARLSRAIAIGQRDGPHAGLAELDALAGDDLLDGAAALHAARGDALERLGDPDGARRAFARASEASSNEHERRWLDSRRARVGVAGA